MRRLRMAAAAVLVLALAGCVPTALSESAVDSAIREVSAAEDVQISSKDSQINSPARMQVEVLLRSGSTAEEAGDVVDAWFISVPDGVTSSLGLYCGSSDFGANLERNTNDAEHLRAAAVEWSTLAQSYPEAVLGYTSPTDSLISVVLPEVTAPSLARAGVEQLRETIAGVATDAGWRIRSTDENGAQQGVALITDGGLPDTPALDYLDALDAGFQSAATSGDVYLTGTFGEFDSSVVVDLVPDEFVNVPVTQIPDLLVASSVWPVIQQFVDHTDGGSVDSLSFSVNGTRMASLSVDNCERPAEERFPLDFEVWDYWASVHPVCTS